MITALQLTTNLFNSCCTDMSSMLENQLFQVKQCFLMSHLHKQALPLDISYELNFYITLATSSFWKHSSQSIS